MSSRLTSAIAAVGFLFSVLPGQAQYAYTHLAQPKEETGSVDPEDGTKTGAYKVLHGVVQGTQGTLVGATVWLHGTRTIVVTNSDGEFELRVPANTQFVELTCGYAGLQEEVVRMASVQAMGSVYLLRSKDETVDQAIKK
jgi:hypothetical protein